ncbi:hypothetical protein GCM10018793_31240 [Streptomyces sulfonofaciens]|uniref:Uncharacterized protein n=1 Tax=Streptomyces sulfonofaciens TaxID=68272 RepID=A0A919L1C0_9ACTN|nr:hypothetical protein [Streptomyces sulfonofaciens]GHH79151.1 hypothetical protein GCM10018793_31240 [Streptomyces sulfonofaciens]
MSVEGNWDLSISTPVGRIEAVLELRRENGRITGTAATAGLSTATGVSTAAGIAAAAGGTGEKVPLTGIVLDGDLLTWHQAITKPLRLNLVFAVTVDGETLTGTSHAGRLPASRVIGRRQYVPAAVERS